MAKQAYHDVTLMPRTPKWRRRIRRGRYYPTGARQLPDGRVEVTFHLPPSILRQWRQAISSGKRIRLFVPE